MNNRKEEIEARLRVLHSELLTGHDFGDWRMSRAFEGLIETLSSGSSLIAIINAFKNLYSDLRDVIQARKNARQEIEDLEKELENLGNNEEVVEDVE